MARSKSQVSRNQAIRVFEARGGILRTSEAIAAGIHPRILYELHHQGRVQCLERGLYALRDLLQLTDPDLVTVAKKIPSGVICLVSALYFHRLTVQIPRWVDVAVHKRYSPPKIDYLPVHFHWFSDKVFVAGIETHDLGGVKVRIYSREKCVVDCFRLRHKVGIDVAIEALKEYWGQGDIHIAALESLAAESRVLSLMTPYLRVVMHEQS